MENNDKKFENEPNEVNPNDKIEDGAVENEKTESEAPEELQNSSEEFTEEVQEEIESAAKVEEIEDAGEEEVSNPDTLSDDPGYTDSFSAEAKQIFSTEKPKSKNGKIIAIISIVAVLLIAVIATTIVNFTARADGTAVVATVGGQKITENDFRFYLAQETYKIQYKYVTDKFVSEGLENPTMQDAQSALADFNWKSKMEDGRTYEQSAKDNAIKAATQAYVDYKKAQELGIALSDDENSQIQQYADYSKEQYGDQYEAKLKEVGVSSHEIFLDVIKRDETNSKLQNDFETNQAKYITTGEDLSKYLSGDKATAKHILIFTSDPQTGEPYSDEKKAEAKAKANEALTKANSGEDFDALVNEYNEDTGETGAGYTFGKGEMVPEFENAAFALKPNEISDIVESQFGYHIIKRLVGFGELESKWASEANVKVKKWTLSRIDIQRPEENAFTPKENTANSASTDTSQGNTGGSSDTNNSANATDAANSNAASSQSSN